jgi:hypothetical protein
MPKSQQSAIAQATLALVVVMLAQCGGQHQVEELLAAKFGPGVPGRDIWATTTIKFFTNNTLAIVLKDLQRADEGDEVLVLGGSCARGGVLRNRRLQNPPSI